MLETVTDPKTLELRLGRGSKAGEEEVEEAEAGAMAEEVLAEEVVMVMEAREEEATTPPAITMATERPGPATTVELQGTLQPTVGTETRMQLSALPHARPTGTKGAALELSKLELQCRATQLNNMNAFWWHSIMCQMTGM